MQCVTNVLWRTMHWFVLLPIDSQYVFVGCRHYWLLIRENANEDIHLDNESVLESPGKRGTWFTNVICFITFVVIRFVLVTVWISLKEEIDRNGLYMLYLNPMTTWLSLWDHHKAWIPITHSFLIWYHTLYDYAWQYVWAMSILLY